MKWLRRFVVVLSHVFLGSPKGREIFEAYFNLENERKEKLRLEQTPNKNGTSTCYKLHTKYSLDDHLKAIENAGFQKIQVESIPIKKPKIFLYIGERK